MCVWCVCVKALYCMCNFLVFSSQKVDPCNAGFGGNYLPTLLPGKGDGFSWSYGCVFFFLMAVFVSCVYLFKAVLITYSCTPSLFALVHFSRDAFGLQGAPIPTIDPDRFHMWAWRSGSPASHFCSSKPSTSCVSRALCRNTSCFQSEGRKPKVGHSTWGHGMVFKLIYFFTS